MTLLSWLVGVFTCSSSISIDMGQHHSTGLAQLKRGLRESDPKLEEVELKQTLLSDKDVRKLADALRKNQ